MSSSFSRSVIAHDSFFKEAPAMRRAFETRFADPLIPRGDRFVWDWWHVPGQYTALRTPAYEFFAKSLYERFHRRLVLWGREVLGAHDVSPPWMSCYVNGCRQELHGDLPHGPWAFVFSLTPWTKRRFEGGETILLRDEILEHWEAKRGAAHARGRGRGLELPQIVRSVPALFNRLTVFDPRIPHGVREVQGAEGVLDGRLVIHGWFVQPRPFIQGPLEEAELADFIGGLGERIGAALGPGLAAAGVLSVRFAVGRDGKPRDLRRLASTLRAPGRSAAVERAALQAVRDALADAKFLKRRAPSRVTLPLIFE